MEVPAQDITSSEIADKNSSLIYTWLIKNDKIELDEEEREFVDNINSYRKEVDVAYQKGYKEGVKSALENKLSESAKILLYND